MQKKSHDWILRVDSTGQENNKYADTHNAIWQFVKNMPLVPEIAYRLRSETTCASTTQFVEFAMRKYTTSRASSVTTFWVTPVDEVRGQHAHSILKAVPQPPAFAREFP